MEKTYYYLFPRNKVWLTLNLAVIAIILTSASYCPCAFFFEQTISIIGVLILSIFAWFYVYAFRHKLAVVTDEYIQIDHNNPLYWKDIKSAEEREILCCCKKRKILVLIPKDNIEYKYNFLQRHNGGFTAFSIPLYGIISEQDEDELVEIIKKKVGKIKKLK